MGKLLLMLLAFCAMGLTTISNPTLKDGRDGKEYQTMTVGNKTIMAENLNYSIDGSICFRDSEDFCNKYGRLYNFKTAMAGSDEEYAQGICPNGWHIPSAEEWVYIIQNLQEGKLLYKEGSPAHRVIPKNPLNLKFAGNKSHSNEKVFLVGKKGVYMSSSTKDGHWTVVNFIRQGVGHEITVHSDQHLESGVSCRCMKD